MEEKKPTNSRQISVVDRIGAINAFTTTFHDHLLQTPGAVLAPALRLAVVHFAREASKCTACAEALPQGACMRPGADLYAAIDKIDHSAQIQGDHVPSEVQQVLLTVVHSIVNHQGRLDEGWYDSVIKKILTTKGFLPSDMPEDDKNKQYLAYVTFSEILLLTVMSHCMSVAMMVMDSSLPPLPAIEEMTKEPMLLEWTELLKRAPRHDEKVCFARYSFPGDFNTRSAAFKSISNDAWTSMKSMMDSMDPCLPVAYATNDTTLFKELAEVYFVPQKVWWGLKITVFSLLCHELVPNCRRQRYRTLCSFTTQN